MILSRAVVTSIFMSVVVISMLSGDPVVRRFLILPAAIGLVAAILLVIQSDMRVNKGKCLALLFLLSFLPSVSFAQFLANGVTAYLGLVARSAWGLFARVDDLQARWFINICIRTHEFVLLIYIVWVAGLLTWFGIPLKIENSGASLLCSLLPFVLFARRYGLVLVTLIAILFSDARMGAAVAMMEVGLYVLATGVRMPRLLKALSAMAVVLLSCALILVIEWETHFAAIAPQFNDDDFRRRVHNFVGLGLLADHWLFGLGFGDFSSHLGEYFGREMTPHGFVYFIWLQAGLVPFLLFLAVSCVAVVAPIRVFLKTSSSVFLALGVSNIGGWMFFFTRPQQDSAVYLLFLILGVSCLGMRRIPPRPVKPPAQSSAQAEQPALGSAAD